MSNKPDIPTICVGNLKVGGTGKTPHIDYMISVLNHKFKLALLSRGYKRKTKGFLITDKLKPPEINADTIGDEPLQIHLKYPELSIAISENRYEGYRKLREEKENIELLLMDDGYQHLSFSPTFKILLTEYGDPFFKDFPLPMGNLREWRSASSEADVIIVTKSPDMLSEEERNYYRQKLKVGEGQHLFFTKFNYLSPIPKNPVAEQTDPATASTAILLTGIANAESLKNYLSGIYQRIIHVEYPDHHYFTEKDIKNVFQKTNEHFDEKTVLFTTEKDYARLRSSDFEKKTIFLSVFYDTDNG